MCMCFERMDALISKIFLGLLDRRLLFNDKPPGDGEDPGKWSLVLEYGVPSPAQQRLFPNVLANIQFTFSCDAISSPENPALFQSRWIQLIQQPQAPHGAVLAVASRRNPTTGDWESQIGLSKRFKDWVIQEATRAIREGRLVDRYQIRLVA